MYLPSYPLSIFDISEYNSPSECVEEDQQKHAEDDEETLADAHTDREHEHLERRVLARDCEETKNHYHEAYEV